MGVKARAARAEPVTASLARRYLGGNGLAARLLLDTAPAGVDAFDPASPVVFAVGPVTDTAVPGNSRACVAGKELLYEYCVSHGVPHKRTGKLIVATGDAQLAALKAIQQ